MTPTPPAQEIENLKRYDLMQVNACYYTTDHEMERSDDGEWVRYEDVEAALRAETQARQEAERKLRIMEIAASESQGEGAAQADGGNAVYEPLVSLPEAATYRKQQSVPTVWDRVDELTADLTAERLARQQAERERDVAKGQAALAMAFGKQAEQGEELADSLVETLHTQLAAAEAVIAGVMDALDRDCRGSVFERTTPANLADVVGRVLKADSNRLTAERLARQQAEREREELRTAEGFSQQCIDDLQAQLTLSEQARAQAEQARARLRTALEVIYTAARGDEKSECWTIRKWLDERDVFNDDIESAERLIEAVCTFTLQDLTVPQATTTDETP